MDLIVKRFGFLLALIPCLTLGVPETDLNSPLYVVVNTNTFLGERVKVSGTVQAVFHDGLSAKSFMVQLEDNLYVRLELPPGAKWIGSELYRGKTRLLSISEKLSVIGTLKREMSKLVIDRATRLTMPGR